MRQRVLLPSCVHVGRTEQHNQQQLSQCRPRRHLSLTTTTTSYSPMTSSTQFVDFRCSQTGSGNTN